MMEIKPSPSGGNRLYLWPGQYVPIIDRTFELPADDTFDEIFIFDTLGGFDANLRNEVLDGLIDYYKVTKQIVWHNVIDDRLKPLYPNVKFSASWQTSAMFEKIKPLEKYIDPTFEHFICSFNGSTPQCGRRLFMNALRNFGYFNPETVSKNHTYTRDIVHGDVGRYAPDVYLNYFIGADSTFEESTNSFDFTRFKHNSNIERLTPIITSSFVHVVGESYAESYYPFITEKFLYSIVCHGLFVANAQPLWHQHLRDYYGFKLYDNIFDYSFDSQPNPVYRTIELLSMLSKFQNLDFDNRRDLYLTELDNINYNFHHFKSGDYKKYIATYDEVHTQGE